MDDGREALSDIDRALAQALDVDVSPDFAARLRRRIASEPPPAAWWRGWPVLVPVSLAAATVAAIGIGMLSTRMPPVPSRLAARAIQLERMQPPIDRTGRRMPPSTPVAVSRSHAGNSPSLRSSEPEVLVPRQEIEMYRRLIARAQQVPAAVVVDAPPDIVAVGAITAIPIDPVKIELIIPSVDGEGDRQ